MTRGEKIKALRLSRGLTQEEVGKACGVSKVTVHKWESGLIKDIRIDKLKTLAQYLNTTVAYIIDEDPGLPPLSLQESMEGRKHPLEELHYINKESADEVVEVNPEETDPYLKVKTEYDIREEELELLKAYRKLAFRDRVKLLHYAFQLQDGGQ